MADADELRRTCAPDEVFTTTERIYMSLTFSLPALFAWLSWVDSPYRGLSGRDRVILAVATAAALSAVFLTKGLEGLQAAGEEGLIISATWVLIAVVAARHSLCQVQALEATALYALGALGLFVMLWHVAPVRALVAARTASGTEGADSSAGIERAPARLAAMWLLSVGLLDVTIIAASVAAFAVGMRPVAVSGLAAGGSGLAAVAAALAYRSGAKRRA